MKEPLSAKEQAVLTVMAGNTMTSGEIAKIANMEKTVVSGVISSLYVKGRVCRKTDHGVRRYFVDTSPWNIDRITTGMARIGAAK